MQTPLAEPNHETSKMYNYHPRHLYMGVPSTMGVTLPDYDSSHYHNNADNSNVP